MKKKKKKLVLQKTSQTDVTVTGKHTTSTLTVNIFPTKQCNGRKTEWIVNNKLVWIVWIFWIAWVEWQILGPQGKGGGVNGNKTDFLARA
jgi:hypothetical protein